MSRQAQRNAGIAGIVFVILLAITVPLTGAPPDVDKPIHDIAVYFTDHRQAQLVSGLLGAIAIPFFLVFLGGFRSLLGAAEGEGAPVSNAAFGAGIALLVAAGVVGTVLPVAITQRVAPGTDEPLLRALYDLNQVVYGVASVLAGAFVGTASLVIFITRVLPRWLAYLGAVVTLLGILGGCAVVYNDVSPLGFLGFIGFLGFLVWVLIAGILMLAGPRAEASAA